MTQERHCLVFPHESCFLGVFSPTPPTVPAPYIHTETHTHPELDQQWRQMFQANQQVFSNANSLPSTRSPTQLLSEQLEAESGVGGVQQK